MRPTFRLVPDFIVPHLNRSTYGNHLHWEDKNNGSFKISRIHQSSDLWNEQCIEVYKAWSMKKKHWHDDDPKKITKAKHRLITALRRNPEIEMLEKESTSYRFRIVHPGFSDNQFYQEDSTGQLNVQVTKRKNRDEVENCFIPNDEIKSCDMKNIPEINTEEKDYSTFSEANMNVSCWPLPRTETFEVQSMFSITEDLFGDESGLEETKASVFTDKCCCEKLLDNYLCNQKCIWHGMPP